MKYYYYYLGILITFHAVEFKNFKKNLTYLSILTFLLIDPNNRKLIFLQLPI